jgi:prevent-host-death family protein
LNEPQDTLAISEFKATCLKVLDQVRRTGRPVVVTRRGESIAMVVPPPPPEPGPGWLGAGAGSARIIGDVVAPVIAEDQWEVLGP